MKTIEKDSEIETSNEAKAFGLRRIERRHAAKKGEVALKDCKVKVTIYLDADVLSHFKQRAEGANAAPYQTQINNELRKLVELEKSKSAAETARSLTDEKTIAFLADRIAERLNEKRAA